MVLSDEAMPVFDAEGIYTSGRWKGLWDLDVRIGEMDREGIAAELVYFGDFRTLDLFHNAMEGSYPIDVVDAGVRAYDRWAYDTFGSQKDRLLLSGAIGSIQDVKGTIKELEWIAEHGFVGTYAPGFVRYPNALPPLYDEFWDPIWAAYADLGLVPIVHAGYGFEQGFAHGMIAESHKRVKGAGGSDLDLVLDLTSGYFNDEGFFKDVKCRQAMWQMMLGGVFDRHPKLKLMMTEVRADWVPATLDHLDKVFVENRAALPATRLPSEQWQEHCLAGLSFMHTVELEMRHEIGIDNIAFGRDYPHTESTWPNTDQYLKVLFSGVPEDETRKMLGENAIRFLGLDQDHLSKVAAEIGPDLSAVIDPDAVVDPALIEHLSMRCGLLKPSEGASLIDELVGPLVAEDLAAVTARG
jgi:predicted TIM-barrel fold metal-dependent hydrolase